MTGVCVALSAFSRAAVAGEKEMEDFRHIMLLLLLVVCVEKGLDGWIVSKARAIEGLGLRRAAKKASFGIIVSDAAICKLKMKNIACFKSVLIEKNQTEVAHITL